MSTTFSIKNAYDELLHESKIIQEAYNKLKKENERLLSEHRQMQNELWQVWGDFQRVVYLLPDESDRYAPLRRLWDRYSDLNVPWKERSFDARRDDALTETGTKPY